ncbi:hypothetical protein [Anaerovorax sp. IOR16]|uniref:hypothetical protein n=1 Tax=Anaerovorax sp. IOR16 TaxID=2773458 RepID=UPI0019D20D18|nr:hypothetical protein [Anaerovorax sp. IOR16]
MNSLKCLVAEYTQYIFTNEEYINAIKPARNKLERIIDRYGDENGERRKPFYFAQLISEQITSERMTNYCIVKSMLNMEKECVAKANAPSI